MGTILRGGTILTMDSQRALLRGDLLMESGKIVSLGTDLGDEHTHEVLDVSGSVVMPGLIQAHVHLCQALFRGMADDLPLLPWLEERIWPLEAAHDARSMRASADLGLAEMLLAGTTAVLDMGTVHHQDIVFEAMVASGIRGLSGKAMMDRGDKVPAALRESTAESLAQSLDLFARWHGTEGGRLGYAFAPRFILSCSEELLRSTAKEARDRDAIVHSHVAEHADERAAVERILGMRDLEALASYGIVGPRAVLAHGVQLGPEELATAAEQETRLVHCPSANLKLASGVAPVVEIRRAGVVMGIGADGAPCNNRMDPWTEIRSAALLAKVRSSDASALPALDVLSMATLDGARVLGFSDRTGSLEIGKRADVIVVDRDVLHSAPGLSGSLETAESVASSLVYSTVAQDIRHVFVDGDCLVRDRTPVRFDRQEVLHRARAEGERLAAMVLG